MKVVVNRNYGGFGLSKKALKMLGMTEKESFNIGNRDNFKFRTSEKLLKVMIEIGKEINDECSNLQIIEIPDDAINPYIDEYDGFETVREGRSW